MLETLINELFNIDVVTYLAYSFLTVVNVNVIVNVIGASSVVFHVYFIGVATYTPPYVLQEQLFLLFSWCKF